MFLNREMQRIKGRTIPNPAIDTFSVYEWLRRRSRSHKCLGATDAGSKLYDIARCFEIAVNGAHHAMMDAFITAQLLQRFIPLLHDAGTEHTGDLLRIGIPFKGGDQFNTANEFSNF
jgi:DNA polymerase III alpha subunit (gram-positive type)